MNKCPCEKCKHYVNGKQHSNLAYDLHYCERTSRAIYQHHGNAYHSAGTWIIPCGRDMYLFEAKAMNDNSKEVDAE